MTIVLAAIDASAAARAVLEAARGLGELLGAGVEAIHVGTEPAGAVEAIAGRAEVPLRVLDGPVQPTLLHALADPSVVAGAFGARATPGGRRPVGRTALGVLQRVHTPVLVVPPEAVTAQPRVFRRLLVPLEGAEASSQPVTGVLCPVIPAEVELVVLHVFAGATVPRALDHPEWDLPLLGAEFLARHCPNAHRIELRVGPVAGSVCRACEDEQADLVVLSWSQDMSAGHATVVHDVLSGSRVPVLLLPTSGSPR